MRFDGFVRTFACVALLVTLPFGTALAQSRYNFVKIADANDVGYCLAINSGGTVVFQRVTGTPWVGDGNVLSQIPSPDAPGGAGGSCPGINDSGDVSFDYAFNGSGETPFHVALLKHSNGVLTELANSLRYPYSPVFSPGVPGPNITINALTNDGSSLWAGVDGVYVVPANVRVHDPLPGVPNPAILVGSINEQHVVPFYYVRDPGNAGGTAGIYRSSMIPLVEGGSATIDSVDGLPVINESNTVAFVARLYDGMVHVLSTNDGISFQDHSGPMLPLISPKVSINDSGRVAFMTYPFAVYTGPDPAADRVIGPGDALDGSVVSSAYMAEGSLNNRGQIAFFAVLIDGRSGVYRADPVNSTPVAGDLTMSTTEDVPASAILSGVDPDNQPLTFAIVTNGTLGVATVADPSTGAVVYTPNANANGQDVFTFRAFDGTAYSEPATVNVNITAVNDGPVALDDSASTKRNRAVTVPVLLNDRDIEGSPLQVLLGSSTSSNGGTVSLSGGLVSYKPRKGFLGVDTFTYRASDGQVSSNIATVTVTVRR